MEDDGRRAQSKDAAEHSDVNLPGGGGDPLVSAPRDISKLPPQAALGNDAHADLVRDDDGGKRRRLERTDEVRHLSFDARLLVSAHEQVRQPERQTVDDHHVHVAEPREGFRELVGGLRGPKGGPALFDVARDSLVHLVVERSSRCDEGPPFAERASPRERERALA